MWRPPTRCRSRARPARDFNAGTLYYKSDAAGSFSFSNALTDSGSGPYSTTFPAIGTAGWTHALETDLTGPPYVSTAYSWTPNPTNPANQTLVGTDAALQSANQVVSFVSDTSLPTGMSASVTAGYFTALSVPVTLANGSDTGSGVNAASGIVERDEAPLDNSDGTCDAFPGSWATVTLSGGNDTTVVSGKCYRYRLKISDNVGNQGTQAGTSATAKVETSPPSDPTLSYGSFTNAALNGGVVYYRPGAASGQFQVTPAGSTDTESGFASYSFPAAASGWSVSGAGASRTYSHTGAPTDPAEPNNVFATNGAGLNSNNVSFTVTPDSTAPASPLRRSRRVFTSTSVGVTLNGGTDGGSGIAAGSSVVERDEAPLDNGDGPCDAFPGSWATVTLSAATTRPWSAASATATASCSPTTSATRAPPARATRPRSTRARRATPRSPTGLHVRGAERRHCLVPAGRGQRPVPGHCERIDRRAVWRCEPYLPGSGLGLEHLRLRERAHVQPHRQPL